jgi:hypothetical protein
MMTATSAFTTHFCFSLYLFSIMIIYLNRVSDSLKNHYVLCETNDLFIMEHFELLREIASFEFKKLNEYSRTSILSGVMSISKECKLSCFTMFVISVILGFLININKDDYLTITAMIIILLILMISCLLLYYFFIKEYIETAVTMNNYRKYLLTAIKENKMRVSQNEILPNNLDEFYIKTLSCRIIDYLRIVFITFPLYVINFVIYFIINPNIVII